MIVVMEKDYASILTALYMKVFTLYKYSNMPIVLTLSGFWVNGREHGRGLWLSGDRKFIFYSGDWQASL